MARDTDFDKRFDIDCLGIIGQHDFIIIGENLTFTFGSRFDQRQIVGTKDHILCRNGNRFTIFRSQDIVCRQHECTGFRLGFHRKWQVACHLVTIEVGIECRADQRMQFDSPAFPKDRFESLDTETMQCRGTVEENRMFLNDIFQDIPYFIADTFNLFLGILDISSNTLFNEFLHDEGLKQFQCHFLRQTALMHFQFRTDNDNGTAGIVNTFTEEVLTETALFPLQHVGKRFERTVARAGDRSATAAIVDKRIDGFLEHTLFIADDDIRRTQFQQAAQTVVTVDDAAVQIIQIRCSKPATIQLYHWTQFRRNDRDDIHDHPFRFIS